MAAITVVALFSISSCGSSSDSDEALNTQLAETQEKIEELQQTVKELKEKAERENQLVDESQEEVTESNEQNTEETNQENSSDMDPDDPSEEAITANLLETYSWFENSEAVEELQEILGIEADGWYGAITREAHLAILETKELSTAGVPDEEPPPCPPQEAMPESEVIPMASIVPDIDGDGNTENGQTYYNADLEVFYAKVSAPDFGPYWVELDDIGPGPSNQWKASFGTDINNDNQSEFWISQIPFGASSVGYRVLIFEDCALNIAYIPDSNELFIEGGTVMNSWRIACENEDGAPVIVQYAIIRGAVEGEGSLTGMVYELSSTGFTFITARNLETFEDPGGPYGTGCESWIHDPPPWVIS